MYPLIPGQSPVLRSSQFAYVFPDIDNNDNTVGIVFSNGLSKEEIRELNQVKRGRKERDCVRLSFLYF